jgi:hypothetical protein
MLTALVTLPGVRLDDFLKNETAEDDDILIPTDTIYNEAQAVSLGDERQLTYPSRQLTYPSR